MIAYYGYFILWQAGLCILNVYPHLTCQLAAPNFFSQSSCWGLLGQNVTGLWTMSDSVEFTRLYLEDGSNDAGGAAEPSSAENSATAEVALRHPVAEMRMTHSDKARLLKFYLIGINSALFSGFGCNIFPHHRDRGLRVSRTIQSAFFDCKIR